MCLASWRTRPSAPVLATRSEPARSTRFILDLLGVGGVSVRPHPQRMEGADLVTTSDPSPLVVRVMEKMEWDREEH